MTIEAQKILFKRVLGFLKYAGSKPLASTYSAGDVKLGNETVVVIAAHGRSEILKQVVSHLLHFKRNDLNKRLSIVVCFSDTDDASLLKNEFLDNDRLHILLCKNEPLGNKWQQAVYYARSLNPKQVVICGSDDLLSYSYLSKCFSFIKTHVDWKLLGVSSWQLFNLKEDVYQVSYRESKSVNVLGSGRIYSAAFLEQVNWRIFDAFLNSGLDYKGLKMARSIDSKNVYLLDTEYTVMSVKGSWDMLNSFDDFEKSTKLALQKIEGIKKTECIQEFGLL